MPDDTTQFEAKLKRLANRLHRGWAKLYPATEKELAAVREAVRLQWEKEQEVNRRIAESKRENKTSKTKTKRAAKSRARGHDSESKSAPSRPRDLDQDRGR